MTVDIGKWKSRGKSKMVGWLESLFSTNTAVSEKVTGQLADTPTRGLDISRTGQLAD